MTEGFDPTAFLNNPDSNIATSIDGLSELQQEKLSGEPIENIMHPFTEQDLQNAETPNQTQVNPLSVVNSYKPLVDNNLITAEITPANFDNMMKVLNVLTREKSDNIVIRDSMIKQSVTQGVIEADMTKVLNSNGRGIDLDIINPSKYVKLFTQFRNQNNIFIIDDSNNSRFIVTNGEIKLFLPKQAQLIDHLVESTDLTQATSVCTKSIDKETRKIIKNLAKDQDYIEYLIQDNQLKAMHIPDTAIYIYPEYLNDTNTAKLDETNAELVLRSSSFLPVDADNYNVNIVKLPGEKYTTVTECKIGGQIDVKIIENCEITTSGNIMI